MMDEKQIELLAAAGYEAARAWRLGAESIHPAQADPDASRIHGIPPPWSMISEEAKVPWRGVVEILEKNWASSWSVERQIAAGAISSLIIILKGG